MATLLLEGFDEYGPPGINIPNLVSLLGQGGWSLSTNGFGSPNHASLVAPLSNSGSALLLAPFSPAANATLYVSKTQPANYSRIVGGVRFNVNYPFNNGKAGIIFTDNSTAQCSIYVHPLSGFIYIAQGENGTPLQTSTASVAYNTTHFLEWDITFNTGLAGGWTIWLDGVQILSGTGTTQQSGNNFFNVFQFSVTSPNGSSPISTGIFDDLYVFDTTTAFDNSVLLTNPNIVTQWGIGDHQTQFTNNGNVVGNWYSATTASYSDSANTLFLQQFTPNVNCTINSIVLSPLTTNGAANFRGVIYSNNSGVPNALLSSGTQVTGCTNGTLLTLPLTTPQALVTGTSYWIGLINDTTIAFSEFDGSLSGFRVNNTYGSGAPGTAPAMTANQASLMLYGLCTGAATNWESEALNPPIGDKSAVASSAANTTDLYIFPAVPVTVTTIHSIGVSGNSRLQFAGSHTIDLMTLSGATLGAGSRVNQPQINNYTWYDSYFDVDPNTSTSWLIAAANAAFHGMKIVT